MTNPKPIPDEVLRQIAGDGIVVTLGNAYLPNGERIGYVAKRPEDPGVVDLARELLAAREVLRKFLGPVAQTMDEAYAISRAARALLPKEPAK